MSADVVTGLIAFLKADADVAAQVGARVFGIRLPAAEAGEFSPLASEQEAKQRGLREARAIVAQTTGLDSIPPPVILGEKTGGDSGE